MTKNKNAFSNKTLNQLKKEYNRLDLGEMIYDAATKVKKSVQQNGNIAIINKEVFINGEKMPPSPTKGNNVTVVSNKIFIDGYELVNGKWKRTLRALWHKWF